MEALKDYEGYYLINKEGEVYGIKRKKMKVPSKGCIQEETRTNKNGDYISYRVEITKNRVKYRKRFRTREEAEEDLKEKIEEYNSML